MKELKRTPITYAGKDWWEVLVEDDDLGECAACDLCIYDGYQGEDNCQDVHGCLRSPHTYFILAEFDSNDLAKELPK